MGLVLESFCESEETDSQQAMHLSVSHVAKLNKRPQITTRKAFPMICRQDVGDVLEAESICAET